MPCTDRRPRPLLPREEGHALRSDGGKVESQKALKMPLICIYIAVGSSSCELKVVISDCVAIRAL
jgi:hypothetical protein